MQKIHFTEDLINKKHNRNHFGYIEMHAQILLQEDKKFPFIYKAADSSFSSLNRLNPVGDFFKYKITIFQ